jgi:hypothetical protein
MRPETREWIGKAEATKDSNYDLVCFLAQQSVEKYRYPLPSCGPGLQSRLLIGPAKRT